MLSTKPHSTDLKPIKLWLYCKKCKRKRPMLCEAIDLGTKFVKVRTTCACGKVTTQ